MISIESFQVTQSLIVVFAVIGGVTFLLITANIVMAILLMLNTRRPQRRGQEPIPSNTTDGQIHGQPFPGTLHIGYRRSSEQETDEPDMGQRGNGSYLTFENHHHHRESIGSCSPHSQQEMHADIHELVRPYDKAYMKKWEDALSVSTRMSARNRNQSNTIGEQTSHNDTTMYTNTNGKSRQIDGSKEIVSLGDNATASSTTNTGTHAAADTAITTSAVGTYDQVVTAVLTVNDNGTNASTTSTTLTVDGGLSSHVIRQYSFDIIEETNHEVQPQSNITSSYTFVEHPTATKYITSSEGDGHGNCTVDTTASTDIQLDTVQNKRGMEQSQSSLHTIAPHSKRDADTNIAHTTTVVEIPLKKSNSKLLPGKRYKKRHESVKRLILSNKRNASRSHPSENRIATNQRSDSIHKPADSYTRKMYNETPTIFPQCEDYEEVDGRSFKAIVEMVTNETTLEDEDVGHELSRTTSLTHIITPADVAATNMSLSSQTEYLPKEPQTTTVRNTDIQSQSSQSETNSRSHVMDHISRSEVMDLSITDDAKQSYFNKNISQQHLDVDLSQDSVDSRLGADLRQRPIQRNDLSMGTQLEIENVSIQKMSIRSSANDIKTIDMKHARMSELDISSIKQSSDKSFLHKFRKPPKVRTPKANNASTKPYHSSDDVATIYKIDSFGGKRRKPSLKTRNKKKPTFLKMGGSKNEEGKNTTYDHQSSSVLEESDKVTRNIRVPWTAFYNRYQLSPSSSFSNKDPYNNNIGVSPLSRSFPFLPARVTLSAEDLATYPDKSLPTIDELVNNGTTRRKKKSTIYQSENETISHTTRHIQSSKSEDAEEDKQQHHPKLQLYTQLQKHSQQQKELDNPAPNLTQQLHMYDQKETTNISNFTNSSMQFPLDKEKDQEDQPTTDLLDFHTGVSDKYHSISSRQAGLFSNLSFQSRLDSVIIGHARLTNPSSNSESNSLELSTDVYCIGVEDPQTTNTDATPEPNILELSTDVYRSDTEHPQTPNTYEVSDDKRQNDNSEEDVNDTENKQVDGNWEISVTPSTTRRRHSNVSSRSREVSSVSSFALSDFDMGESDVDEVSLVFNEFGDGSDGSGGGGGNRMKPCDELEMNNDNYNIQDVRL